MTHRQARIGLATLTQRVVLPVVVTTGGDIERFAQLTRREVSPICHHELVDGVNIFSLLPANEAVAFANMSRSICTWRSLRRSSMSSWLSAVEITWLCALGGTSEGTLPPD